MARRLRPAAVPFFQIDKMQWWPHRLSRAAAALSLVRFAAAGVAANL
jgi:hypothetical protein